MTPPLMMLGPGGDYVTRFDVKGEGLIKTHTQQVQEQDRDSESAGNGAAWGFLPGRGRKTKKNQTAKTQADRYEHTESAALPATYVAAGPQGVANLHQQLAMLQAIENWLGTQEEEIGRLAAVQTVTEAELSRDIADDAAPIRVIRWNGGTMDLPTPKPALITANTTTVPEPTPCHAFATEGEAAVAIDNTTPPERSADDGQPEPHAQADENPYADSRHPALQRLFADDARARRSLGRLKGHGLRARRSAHQKGLPQAGCEQGALFGAVA